MKQRRLTRGISGIITVVLLIGVIAAALPTAAKGTDGGTSSAVYYSTDENGYMMYKENNSDAPLAEKDISVDVKGAYMLPEDRAGIIVHSFGYETLTAK